MNIITIVADLGPNKEQYFCMVEDESYWFNDPKYAYSFRYWIFAFLGIAWVKLFMWPEAKNLRVRKIKC